LEAAENSTDLPISPYAPKRRLQHRDNSVAPDNSDSPFPQAVFDWKRAKETAGEEHVTTPEGAHHKAAQSGLGERRALDAVEHAVEAARKAINESPLHLADLPRAPQLAPDASNDGRDALGRSAGMNEPRRKGVDEADIENILANLRRLRPQHATQLPRATKLPPVAPLVPSESADAQAGQRKSDPFQVSPRSLEPTLLTPPPVETRRHPNMMLGVAIGCSLIAGVVYYFLDTGGARFSNPTPQAQIEFPASGTTLAAVETSPPTRAERIPSVQHEDQQGASEATPQAPPSAVPAAMTSAQQEITAARTSPAPAAAASDTSAPKSNRKLDPETVALLIKEAEKHISVGDVVTARMIFQRAAEAGDATAAMALAATYDPAALAKLGVMGMGADVEKARAWYRIAESFGSAEAKQRLRSLDRQ